MYNPVAQSKWDILRTLGLIVSLFISCEENLRMGVV